MRVSTDKNDGKSSTIKLVHSNPYLLYFFVILNEMRVSTAKNDGKSSTIKIVHSNPYILYFFVILNEKLGVRW